MVAEATNLVTPAAVTLPEPGMYPDVPFDVYKRWPALSNSRLEFGQVSMLHLKAVVDGKLDRPDTDALAFGRALHTRLLEPARYKAEYRTITDFEQDTPGQYKNYRASNEYKDKLAKFREIHSGCTFIQPEDAPQLEGMTRAVFAHPAVAMLRESGGCELSMTWQHSTGLRLKARMDKFTRFQRLPTIIDIKGVRSCQHDKLSKQINDLGWHRKAATYIDGVKELTGEIADFIFICIEKTFPYGVAVRQIGKRSLDLGRTQVTGILQRWQWCVERGVFDGFGDDIEEIEVPSWEFRKNKQSEELA